MTTEEKRSNTNLNRYGVSNVAQLPEVQEKRCKTFEDKRTTIMFYQEPRVNIIDGEKLTLYRLNKEVADEWLNTYHPFRAPRGNVLCLGLVKNDIIYAIMTFKKSRDTRFVAELSRLFMLPTYQILHGYDILSAEASSLVVGNIIAYVNMSFENYLDYESIGMKYVRDMQRTKWWVRGEDRMSDASRRQYKLSQETLLAENWISVYDCGQRVYVV